MDRNQEKIDEFVTNTFGVTLGNMTVWMLENVSKDIEKNIKDLR